MNNESTKLKAKFAEAANSLTAFFKSSTALQQSAYKQGQKDALNEILNYALKISGGDLRKVSNATLIAFVQEKVQELELNEGPSQPMVEDVQISPDFYGMYSNQAEMMKPRPNMIESPQQPFYSMGSDLLRSLQTRPVAPQQPGGGGSGPMNLESFKRNN
eukprot:TRINITY_DN8251_c0_g1_i4.p1 TRINITY_DN8251_c0_g1~~TRINITY_DN8251_c0_g1_i4.p1  ORF type:complete len:160 (-),score=44.22 TRINITY_DN8251_c0_g1_i4:22-501(-)